MNTFPRRFYRDVTTLPHDTGWQIALDGKLLRSPAKAEFILPTEALAQAVRDEWDAQQDHIRPHSMPLMQLASTAIDRVAQNHGKVVVEAAAYAASDLVSYRAERPEELVRRQTQFWQPLLDWANNRFDTALQTTTSIIAIAQSEDNLKRFEQVVAALNPWQLTGLASLTGTTGSLVIALALLEGQITVDDAVKATQLDEIFQGEHWGEDVEALQRRQAMAQDIADTTRFLALLC